jgi:hypothetical protein
VVKLVSSLLKAKALDELDVQFRHFLLIRLVQGEGIDSKVHFWPYFFHKMKLESAFCESNKTMTTINKSIWRCSIVMYSRLTCQVAVKSLSAASPSSQRSMSGRILLARVERSWRVRVPELTRAI